MFKPLSPSQVDKMLHLQAQNNAVVHADWLKKGWPFLRAVVVEGGEGMEHVGWKWWKAQTPDLPQARLELVDIWHFILSDVVVKHEGVLENAAQELQELSFLNAQEVAFDGTLYALSATDLIQKFELTIGLAVSRRFHLGLFQSMMSDVGLSWESMFKVYVGKNVLNQFRQANGYKQGTYKKVWFGEEDNVHLDRILESTDENSPVFVESVKKKLNDLYSEVQKA